MARNHLFTAKVWQNPRVRQLRQALSVHRAYRMASAAQRRLPDYLIAGTQKSGTTSLWYYLNEHPNVEPAMIKETHYFDNEYRRGPAWYRMHFPLQRGGESSTVMSNGSLTGESTANHLLHPLAPQRVASTLPHVKIIFLLRNPVDRAFSHYQLKLRRRQEPLTFEGAIDSEAERLAGEEERLVREPNYYSQEHDQHSYLARGRYLEQILRWQKVIPAERMLILESGEFFARSGEVYQRVLEFLYLPPHPAATFGNRFPGKYQDKMSPATRRQMVDYFSPFNERLYAHLGVAYPWDR